MSVTYQQIYNRIQRLLADEESVTYSDDLIYDGVVAAHSAILPWVPKMASVILTAGSDPDLFALPSDLYSLQAIQLVVEGKVVPRATLSPGTVRVESNPLDWVEYPRGYIDLSRDLSVGEEIMVYYLAYWTYPANVTDFSFVMKPPQECHQGMIYYAAHHCLRPSALTAARLRQFNLRIDSGTPDDNPVKIEAEQLYEHFIREMKLQPPYVKVGI